MKGVAFICVAVCLPEGARDGDCEMLSVQPAWGTERGREGSDETTVKGVVSCSGGGGERSRGG